MLEEKPEPKFRGADGEPLRLWRVRLNLVAYVLSETEPTFEDVPDLYEAKAADGEAEGRWSTEEVFDVDELNEDEMGIGVFDDGLAEVRLDEVLARERT